VPVAVRRVVKAIAALLLGCSAALLVACGGDSKLIPGDEASTLRDTLASVESACARGQVDEARASAAKFQGDVDSLATRSVDRRLLAKLRDGAGRLQRLVDETCQNASQTPTQTETQPAPPVTTTPTTTQQTTTTAPTDTGTTTTPPSDGGTTTPGDGGGTTPPSDGGGGTTPPGGSPNDGSNGDGANQGTPGGALAPGQGGAGNP
jgi:hypothetical protein